MTEVLQPIEKFNNFNEFFYRALKPDARPCSAPDDPRVVVSPADCRSVVFDRMTEATGIWVKGREFSVERLMGNAYPEDAARYRNGALGVFRLAPQDYHRFHVPVDGIMGEPKTIEGEYYTVNPMAIRSALDVYGENVRVLVPIDSVAHGRVMVVCVGAMMVGSTVITRKAGEKVSRAEELGYFKFGGSTLLVLFEEGVIKFDRDLADNSKGPLETLVRKTLVRAFYCLLIDTNLYGNRSELVCQLVTALIYPSMNQTCPRKQRMSLPRKCKKPSVALKAALHLHPQATNLRWMMPCNDPGDYCPFQLYNNHARAQLLFAQ